VLKKLPQAFRPSDCPAPPPLVRFPQPVAEVLGFGLVEAEDHRHEAEVAEFVSEPLQDHHPAFSKRPNRSTPFFPMVSMTSRILQEIDELRDFDVVDGDLGLVLRGNDQVPLLGPLQF
jgi:hypothetical protein